MDEEAAANGVWTSLRALNIGYVTIVLGIAVIALAIYFLRARPVSIGDALPSLDLLESIAFRAAAALIIIALVAMATGLALPSEFEIDDLNALGRFRSAVTQLSVGYVFILVALAALITGALWVKHGPGNLAEAWEASSLDGFRNFAIGAAIVLLLTIVIISAVRFFWPFGHRVEFTSIAPFTISGSDDKQKGLVLANALQAKLMEIKRDTQVMDDVLRSEGSDSDSAPPSQDKSEIKSFDVYRKFDLELKFQGVDVGGLLKWAFDWFATGRAMQITIAEQGDKAIVSGALRTDGTSYVYASVDNKNDRIVAAVAYSKLRESLVAQQEEFQGLDWSDIEKLHRTIMSMIQLRSQSESKITDYGDHHQVMSKLIAKAPRLESLLVLGSEIAMKAGEVESALAFLDRSTESLVSLRNSLENARRRVQNLKSEEDSDRKQIGNKALRDAHEKFVSRYNSLLVQRQRIVSSCALPFVERLNNREQPETVFVDALTRHKSLLKIHSGQQKRPVRIAIVAGVPQRELVRYDHKSHGTWTPGKLGLDNFADTLGLIVSTLVSKAALVFVPLGPRSQTRGLSLLPIEDEIAAALEAAAAAQANVVLIPFALQTGPGSFWKTRFEAIKKYAGKMIIVSPALSKTIQGQEQNAPFPPSDLDALFVGNVDVDGRYKGATLLYTRDREELVTYPGALWAPGTRIPRLGSDGMWQTTYGSPYAVATAGAVLANLFAMTENVTPREIIAAVRKTLQQTDRADPSIGILDQEAALNAIASGRPGAGASSTDERPKDVCATKKSS